MSSTVAASSLTTATSVTSDSAMPPSKRQKLSEDDVVKPEPDSKDGVLAASHTEDAGENAQKNDAASSAAAASGLPPSVALSLQKDPSWMLGDVDSFGGLGPIPSMNAVLEKRTSSQFSISSLLPSSVSTSTTGIQSTAAEAARTEVDSGEATTDNEGQGSAVSATTATTASAVVPTLAEGSGGNTKYMDPNTGDYMYPENVKPMSFYDKQRLVQKITMLPSQYLRGLMDVISKYQPDTVRQIDDDGYAFDLGQMNENTVWAISDYVKDSMIELDGYIKSLNQTGISLSTDEDRQSEGTVLTATSAASSSSPSSTVRHFHRGRMPFVKVLKNKAYFKRYQVKYRRRREGKTDYRARKRLITQDKNKYNSPKYRLVVRITNKQVICQIAYAEIDGDKILCQATSAELPRYGLTVGLKNYAAAYATGLLVGRRVLQKLGLDEDYEGNTEVDGEIVKTESNGRTYFVEEVADEKRPFRCYLDCGLRTTTTGNRVFGALKGAADAGLDIPHSEKRFPGYSRDDKSYDAEVHRDRIFAVHVAEHMKELEEDDPEMLASHYAEYVKAKIDPDELEDLITKVHEAIREDPSPAAKKDHSFDKKYKKQAKRSLQQRKARVAQKKAHAASKQE